ncbi:MAG TPA: aspartyl protease family protein [Pyrinomonadaceae bacterium]|nr:aspartyl protease family protein [Pyrinomonadaceae bacterium]
MKKLSPKAVGGLVVAIMCAALVAEGGPGVAASTTARAADKAHDRAERAMRDGEFETAEKLFRELLAKKPHDAGVRLGLGFALLKQRKNQDAFDQGARVVAVEPMSSRAHALIGSALLNSGDFRLSVEEFRTALSFNENETVAIAGLAMVDFYENRVAQSLEGLRRAVSLDPGEPDYHFNLGQVAARFERYAEAANSYERFLRIAPRADIDRRARIRGLIDFLRYLGTQNDLFHAEGTPRNIIPFELVNNRPVIKVRINGSKDVLRFVVDTGAGMCVISDEAANKLGIKAVARGGLARAIGGGGRFEIVYGFLQSLAIGEARIERVPVYIRQFFNTQEPVDGYVGLSIISKYLASVDYGARTMTLLRDDARPLYDPTIPPPGVEIPIRTTSSGFWSGEVKLGGVEKPVNFIIDTGASVSVISAALAERENMGRFARDARITIYGAAGLSDNVQTLTLPHMALGSHTRPNVYAAVLDMDPINETSGFEQTGIVGGNVLRNFRVTFDFRRAIIRLEPVDNAPEDDARPKSPVVTSQS